MIKKTINTFEGGIDQDTDKKLVKPNTYFGLKNGTLTKDGKEGVITTLKDFKEFTGTADLNLDDDNILILEYKNAISEDDVLFNISVSSINTDILANGAINSFNDLYKDLLENTSIKVYKNNTQIFIWLNGTTASTISSDLTVVSELNNSSITKNLGLKEIALEDNKRLIFLFRQGSNNSFYIQVIHYNDSLDLIYNTDFIFKGTIPSADINSDNIIYNKESELLHRLYWVEGVNFDKLITFYINIDPNFYADWNDYILNIRNEIYSQFNNLFKETTYTFFPQPYLYDISYYEGVAYDNSNIENADPPIDPNDINIARLKPTEKVMCFYRLKKNNNYSNISIYSKSIVMPTSNIGFDFNYTDLRYNVHATKVTNAETPKVSRWTVEFEIDTILNTKYDFIELFVIHYNIKDSYKIRKISTQPLKNSKNKVFYNEDWNNSNLEEFELDQLIQIKNTNDISKNQIIYKNRRIKANLKNTNNKLLLNFDARAYRFNSVADGQEASLLDRNGNQEVLINGTAPDYDIENKLDLINSYNNEYTNYADWKINQQYKYREDGSTLGGSGLNINYSFIDVKVEDTKLTSNLFNNALRKYTLNGNNNKRLPSGKEIHTGFKVPVTNEIFQGGEVYRFFINFWNGETVTLAKWIGDIKFPENPSPLIYNGGNPLIYGKTIAFTVNVENIKDSITAFSIGVVPRKKEDKSVIITTPEVGLAGVIQPAKSTIQTMCLDDLITSSDSIDLLHTADSNNFVSSTTNYLNNLKKLRCIPFNIINNNLLDNFEGDFFIKRLSSYSYTQFSADTKKDASQHVKNGFVFNTLTSSTLHSDPELISINSLKDVFQVNSSLGEFKTVSDLVPDLPDSVEFSMSTQYFDYAGPNNELYMPEQGESSSLIREGSSYPKCLIGLSDNATQNYRANQHDLISLRKNISNQYGGNTFESREFNVIEISSYTKVDSDSTIKFSYPKGDSFVNYHDLILSHGYYDNPLTTHEYVTQQGMMTFVESSSNFSSVDDSTQTTNPYRFFDLPLYTQYFLSGIPTVNFPNVPDIISFNKPSLFPITTSLNNNIVYDYTSTIIISDKKILGQTTDNWQIFGVNNEKIIDPNWGAINKLIDEKDRLIIFQENAVSQQYVDQIQQNINDISEITLGTGDVAGQHVYILKNRGVQSNNSVIQIDDDVIFQDLIRNKIMTINQGEIKGLSNQLIKDDYLGLNRGLTYDRESNLVFIPNYEKYLDDSTSSLIVYDNNIKRITSNETFVADFDNSLIYTGLTNLLKIDTEGKFNVFNKANTINVSNLTSLLEISFIVNPQPTTIKTFTNLQLDYETLEYDVDNIPSNLYNFAPESIRVQTQYQDTGYVTINSSNFRRKGRTYKFTIPRNQNSTDRIRDYYAIVTIKFSATANRELKFNSVITSYGSSN